MFSFTSNDSEKIYGENDPDKDDDLTTNYTLSSCIGESPIEGNTVEYCMNEAKITLYRSELGETVKNSGGYTIDGTWININYDVNFVTGELIIKKRPIYLLGKRRKNNR